MEKDKLWFPGVRDGERERWTCLWRGSMRELYGNGTVLCLDSGDGYMKLHVIKLQSTTHTHNTHTSAYKIWVSSVDSTNVSFLVLILYYSYTRCYPWGRLSKGCKGLLCTLFFFAASSESISFQNKKKYKQNNCSWDIFTYLNQFLN